jgi:hypothetical protein
MRLAATHDDAWRARRVTRGSGFRFAHSISSTRGGAEDDLVASGGAGGPVDGAVLLFEARRAVADALPPQTRMC